jgi:hypothetical protein
MFAPQQLSSVAFDLTRLHRRTVTSFYSNLVTRPTGRAVRIGLEQQLAEVAKGAGPCLSILDFSQVRIMDYSCADEIVAKLLMRYAADDRPVDAYFVARGLQDHHLEAVDAVLERHDLLLVTEGPGGDPELLGPCSPSERECWSFLLRCGWVRADDLAEAAKLEREVAEPLVRRFVTGRVALMLGGKWVCPIPRLNHG